MFESGNLIKLVGTRYMVYIPALKCSDGMVYHLEISSIGLLLNLVEPEEGTLNHFDAEMPLRRVRFLYNEQVYETYAMYVERL